jgi:hypothetical protein
MASIVVAGDTSGTVTLAAPAVSGTTTLTLPTTSGTIVTTASGQTLNSPTIATPTITGQATIPTINLTGGQITFPATQNPSTDANTLDDYEEGSWTPTLVGSTSNPSSISYNEQFGRYVKIGRQVTVQFYLATNSYSGGSGNMRVGALPFTSAAERQPTGNIGAYYYINFQAVGYTFPTIAGVSNSNTIEGLTFSNNGPWAPPLLSAWPTGTYAALQGTLTYFV